MVKQQRLTAIIERENDGFVALCPELDIASQGSSIEEARAIGLPRSLFETREYSWGALIPAKRQQFVAWSS